MMMKNSTRLGPCCRWLGGLLVLLASGGQPLFAQSGSAADGALTPPADPTPSIQRRPARLGDSLAVDPGQEWTPGQQSAEDRVEELRRKLSLGRNALEAGNLVAPFDASALNYFRQALAIDPDNVEAQAGLDGVADGLLAQARAQLAQGSRDAAVVTLNAVANFRPDYPALAALRSQLDLGFQIEELLAQAAQAEADGILLSPVELSALGLYDRVLGLAPGNETALAGLDALQAGSRQQIVDTAAAGDFDAALAALDQSQASFASATSEAATAIDFSALREQLISTRASGWEQRLAAARSAFDAGNLDQAETELEALLAAGYGGDLSNLRARIERQRLLNSYEPGSMFADALASGGSGPSMVVIPSGRFLMGSPASEDGRNPREGPTIEITLAEPFAMARTEVTVAQFAEFVAATGYRTSAEISGGAQIYDGSSGGFTAAEVNWRMDFKGDDADGNLPAIFVSWEDAAAYARWLSEQTGRIYRLPSEAEFEYVQRAGSQTPYYWGDGSPPDELENLTGGRDEFRGWNWPDAFNRYGDGHWGPAPVASYLPNPMNLFDIGGNVLEWAADCFADSLQGLSPDGRARQVRPCETRSLRGGAWAVSPTMARSASRASALPQRPSPLVGFRVLREL